MSATGTLFLSTYAVSDDSFGDIQSMGITKKILSTQENQPVERLYSIYILVSIGIPPNFMGISAMRWVLSEIKFSKWLQRGIRQLTVKLFYSQLLAERFAFDRFFVDHFFVDRSITQSLLADKFWLLHIPKLPQNKNVSSRL